MRQVVGDENYNKFTNHLNQVQDPEVRQLFEEYGSQIEFEPMTSERSGVMKTTKMRLGKGWNVMESEIKLHQISSDPKYGLGKSIQRELWEHTAGSNE